MWRPRRLSPSSVGLIDLRQRARSEGDPDRPPGPRLIRDSSACFTRRLKVGRLTPIRIRRFPAGRIDRRCPVLPLKRRPLPTRQPHKAKRRAGVPRPPALAVHPKATAFARLRGHAHRPGLSRPWATPRLLRAGVQQRSRCPRARAPPAGWVEASPSSFEVPPWEALASQRRVKPPPSKTVPSRFRHFHPTRCAVKTRAVTST
jgi:hypothetical protein